MEAGTISPIPNADCALPDESLLERLRGGDRSALDELMDRHAESVLNYVHRMIGDRAWAEDLAQETFLAVFRHASSFRRGAKFRPWLFRIARNASIDFARRRGVRRRPLAPPDGMEEPRPFAEERERIVQEALGALPEKFRAALVMVEIEGLKYEEAAEALGCSTKTLGSRLTRARERLRRLLEDHA